MTRCNECHNDASYSNNIFQSLGRSSQYPIIQQHVDSDSETSTVSGMDELSVTISDRLRNSKRIDYHLLNDGSDEEAGPEDRIAKKSRLSTTGGR
jgi:hypothetical protein